MPARRRCGRPVVHWSRRPPAPRASRANLRSTLAGAFVFRVDSRQHGCRRARRPNDAACRQSLALVRARRPAAGQDRAPSRCAAWLSDSSGNTVTTGRVAACEIESPGLLSRSAASTSRNVAMPSSCPLVSTMTTARSPSLPIFSATSATVSSAGTAVTWLVIASATGTLRITSTSRPRAGRCRAVAASGCRWCRR